MAKESAILSWYDERAPRMLDLVGDYAGKELFVVDGDSLLRTAWSTGSIDFDGELPRHAPWKYHSRTCPTLHMVLVTWHLDEENS